MRSVAAWHMWCGRYPECRTGVGSAVAAQWQAKASRHCFMFRVPLVAVLLHVFD